MSGAGRIAAWRGALDHLLDRTGRRRAGERLALALPELGADERRRVVRDSFVERAAARRTRRAVERLSDVELCRRLTVAGWRHLEAAEREAPVALFLTSALGLPALVHRALAIYRGPLRAIGSPLRRREPPATSGATRLLVVAGDEPCGGRGPLELLAETSRATGAAVVPAFAAAAPGGWRLELEAAIAPLDAGAEPADAEAGYRATIARRMRAAPAAWPWADAEWPPR